MVIRDLLVTIKDAWAREPRMIKRYYRETLPANSSARNAYVFMVDGRIPHGGMFDRLKGMITVYAIAKSQDVPFFIHFTYPFRLEKYLEPNSYDWRIKDEDMIYHYPESLPVIAYGEINHPQRLLKKRKGQVHFYYGYNSLAEVNEHFHTHYDWGELYRELFRPMPYLQQYIDHYLQEVGTDYFVVHTRFMNLLGDKVETAINPELSDNGKAELIHRILQEIRHLMKSDDLQQSRLMLASDSMAFIHYALKEIPEAYVVPGKVKHIDTAGETDDSENVKLFTDYYLIAHAKSVYNIVAEGMWPSAFPEYAAKIGGKPFKRIKL